MKRPARKPREADLVRAIMAALNLMPGVHVLRLNAGVTLIGEGKGRRAIRGVEAGTPDLLVMLRDGRVLWLEAKTPIGRVSPAQKQWHAQAAKLGHAVLVVRDVQQAIDAVREAKP